MLNFNFRLFIYFSFLTLSIFTSVDICAESNTSTPDVKDELQVQTATENYIDDEILDEELVDDENIAPFPEEAEIEIEPEESFFSFFDSTHEFLSGSVEAMAKNIDEFFVDDEEFYESSGSYLRLRQNMVFSEGGQSQSFSEVRFKLRLPNTKKKFKLFFESSSSDEPYNVTTQTEKTTEILGKEGDYILGISTLR